MERGSKNAVKLCPSYTIVDARDKPIDRATLDELMILYNNNETMLGETITFDLSPRYKPAIEGELVDSITLAELMEHMMGKPMKKPEKKHADEKEDKALIRKMVKSKDLKKK